MATRTIQLTLPADELSRINEVCAEHGLTFNDACVRYAQQVVAYLGITFELDAELAARMERICADLGLPLEVAFRILSKKIERERRLPPGLEPQPANLPSAAS